MVTLSNRENQRRRYHELKKKGICTDCHIKKVTKGKTTCEECRKRRRVYYRQYWARNKKWKKSQQTE